MDEMDLALLDGLHVNPRASFDELGRVLGISGPTVARRWRRMVDAGKAWVSSALGPDLPVVGGLLEAECEPGDASAVAAQFACVPQVFSTHITTGRSNVYALLVTADERALAQLLIDVLPRVKGIRAAQTASVYQLFSGTHWRLGSITTAQAQGGSAACAAQHTPRLR